MNRTEARHKLRRDALGRIKSERFKTSAALASALGDEFSPSYVSQILSGHRGIGDDVATKIEERLGLPAGWMDEERMAVPQTCAHTDLIDAWEFLLSDEQATILADIKRRAAHNSICFEAVLGTTESHRVRKTVFPEKLRIIGKTGQRAGRVFMVPLRVENETSYRF